MIKVLITEDSPVVRGYLEHILNQDPDIEVVGIAKNGEEAVKMTPEYKPDVITMDIHMPRMDGFEATRQIMEKHPVPIVICSASWNPEEVDKTFKSMEAGAVVALEKPRGMGHPESEKSVKELLQTIKLMSSVKVVRRWRKNKYKIAAPPKTEKPPIKKETTLGDVRAVAVGASTGGPIVLRTILSGIPKGFPVPILVVQHIAQGFLSGLGDWLQKTTGLPVKIAGHGDKLQAGHVYLAPDAHQMGLDKSMKVALVEKKPENNLCPAVSYLFRSVANTLGSRSIGILLTGMGRDGAKELKLLKDKGSITIAQDKESSIVHGMPGEAIKRGGATYVLPSAKIANMLNKIIMEN